MSLRSLLILVSLAANIILVFSFRGSLKNSESARQMLIQQETELSRVTKTAAQIKPGMGGLSARGIGTELALIQKVKLAVASELARNKSREMKCSSGTSGNLGLLSNQMNELKKKIDFLVGNNSKDMGKRDQMVDMIEDEARKMKYELLAACSRR